MNVGRRIINRNKYECRNHSLTLVVCVMRRGFKLSRLSCEVLKLILCYTNLYYFGIMVCTYYIWQLEEIKYDRYDYVHMLDEEEYAGCKNNCFIFLYLQLYI